MGTKSFRLGFRVIAFAILFAGGTARGDQTTAQLDASHTHDRGSNDSLNESYDNALTAVDHFFNMNIPGAVTYGLKAYGEYRNSNKMDDLRDRNRHLANTMGSLAGPNLNMAMPGAHGTSDNSASSVTGNTNNETWISPYARIDKSFLHTGKGAVMAEKFEKMSGMNRDKMFDMMVDLHAHSKSPTDPDFIPWAMKSYKDITAKMPNPEFREKLESLGGYLDTALSSGLAKSTLAKFVAMDAPPAAGTAVAAAAPAPAEAPRAPASVPAVAAAAPAPVVAAPPAADTASASPGDSSGLSDSATFAQAHMLNAAGHDRSKVGLDHLALEPVDGFLGDVVNGHVEETPTIFKEVSAKIKEMSVRQRLERRTYAISGIGANTATIPAR